MVSNPLLVGSRAVAPRQGEASSGVSPLQMWLAAGFLVSVPVFAQAPLVRLLPWASLVLTLGWLGLGVWLWRRSQTAVWGDLIVGFTWSWFAGSIYWGWWRWEPIIHIPIEALAVPLAMWCLWRGFGKIGNWFYLGSLLGTAVTDGYFWSIGLIDAWREVVRVPDPALASPILQAALVKVQTPWGLGSAAFLASFLLIVGLVARQQEELHWHAFSGAVLFTLLVDGLFAASVAVLGQF
ncbi:MAG: DUF3120 domain-containing protein [Cyanobacteria bacterium J06641_5]